MDVTKLPLLTVFEAKQRLEVPLFQRQYVWDEEHQWYPLWEDIERKFIEALEGRTDAPTHFLGAMVLDQKQTATGHVVVRAIIDGQQRLTTFQLFLSAYRDFAREEGCGILADECNKFLFNTGMMTNPDIDKFKIRPTQLDREQFQNVIESQSKDELLKRYPLVWRKWARKPEPRPRMVEAYIFFYNSIQSFFCGDDEGSPIESQLPLEMRMDECFQALRRSLMVVVIDLQKEDDPQVIFETLNARGEPLLPADLLRNYIFFRVSQTGLNVEDTYKKYWAHFDDEFWREEVKQGRLNRPRSDLFMQHFLASYQGHDIPIKHLYVEYRHWIQATNPFEGVEHELQTLERMGRYFRRLIAPELGDVIYPLSAFLEAYDIRTAYPLLLALMDSDLTTEQWREISSILESYLLRRAVCCLGTKNYNKIFLSLTRSMRKSGVTAEGLRAQLLGQTGESGMWPDDAMFKEAWLTRPLYGPLNSPKLVHLFMRLNQTYMSAKSEHLVLERAPTIEHIMPQSWVRNWPLQSGASGMEGLALLEADDADEVAKATRERNAAIQGLGNLTILSHSLNAAQSNLPWAEKRPELMRHSLLPINQSLQSKDVWDEAAIMARASEQFEKARVIWPR